MSLQPIAVISDTQRTNFVEKIFLRREDNSRERDFLLRELAKENPSLVIHLGDACFSPTKKNIADLTRALKQITQLTAKKILLPGNHDYKLTSNFKNYLNLPAFETCATWQLQVYGANSLIFLNTNKFRLSKKLWLQQVMWFEETLKAIDKDPAIKSAIVFTHHPPFTNSSTTSDARQVKESFLKPFFESSKTKALFSGHVHAYERFEKNNKTFFVVGGGGGPRVKLDSGRHIDSFNGPVPRPFHYALISQNDASLKVEIKGFYKQELSIKPIEVVNLPF